jgi:hypothetical protein
MASDLLKVCEMWDVTPPELPPRSRLYHLPPIGVGTPYVESLTGYVARLAAAHNVRLSQLITHELLPLLGPKYLIHEARHLSPFWSGHSRALNGARATAVEWTQVLERLTLRTELRFLTLQSWAEVLTPRWLMRPTRAWCPACYEEWRQAGQEVYEQLLWTLASVRVCSRHRRTLSTRCPYPDCGRDLFPLGPKSRPGYCSKCERWLGIAPETVPPQDENRGDEQMDWEIWVADSIGELLAAAPTLPALPRREKIAHAVGMCVEQAAMGKVSALARALRLSLVGVWEWVHTARVPQLDHLLRLCDLLDISLLRLLTEADLHVGPLRTDRPWMMESLPQRQTRQPFDTESVRQALEKVLEGEEDPPPSVTEVGRRLDYSCSVLRHRFPELCRAISAQRKAFLLRRAQEKRQELCDQIRQAVLSIHAQGRYPNMQLVSDLIGIQRPFLVPGARETWFDTLHELGWLVYPVDESTSEANSSNDEVGNIALPNRQNYE